MENCHHFQEALKCNVNDPVTQSIHRFEKNAFGIRDENLAEAFPNSLARSTGAVGPWSPT